MHRRTRLSGGLLGVLALLALCAVPARAQEYFAASINAAQQVPTNPSGGTGIGCFSVDLAINTVTYHIEFSGLVAPESAAHVHGFAPPGAEAGVLVDLGTGNPKTGSFTLTAGEMAQFLDGQTYVNIHSQMYPSGEIRGQILEPEPDRFCFGDSAAGACPCGNLGLDAGCANSTGVGATLRGDGVWCLSLDTFRLEADQLPIASVGLFFVGTSAENGGAGSPFGDGLRCVSGVVIRLGTKSIQNGSAEFGVPPDPPISSFGNVQPAETRYYQLWYRNNAGPCGTGYNLTNGLRITWGA